MMQFSPLSSPLSFQGAEKKILARMEKNKDVMAVWFGFFLPASHFQKLVLLRSEETFLTHSSREREKERDYVQYYDEERVVFPSSTSIPQRGRGREVKEEGQTSHKTRGGDNFSSSFEHTFFPRTVWENGRVKLEALRR